VNLPAQAVHRVPLIRVEGTALRLGQSTTLPVAFGQLFGIRELADGTALLVDTDQPAIYQVNFSTGAATVIGHEGAGPGEYMNPRFILPLQGDTSTVFDARQWRWIFLDGARMLTHTVGFATATVEQIRGVDRQGRIYYTGAERSAGGAGPDSLPILRLDPSTSQVDTLGQLRMPPARPSRQRSEVLVVGVTGPFGLFGPFAARDDWAVTGSGDIAVARVTPYRVDRLAPRGSHSLGPTLAYQPVAVTAEDRAAYAAGSGRARLLVPGAGGTRREIAPPAETTWPEVKPPFGPGAVRIAPDATVWVTRSPAWSEAGQTLDVIGSRGERVGVVTTRAGVTVLGFGPHAIYLVEEDADGLFHLWRQGVQWQ
jgi:DNA-binding beta-propeller fold protein YncE